MNDSEHSGIIKEAFPDGILIFDERLGTFSNN